MDALTIGAVLVGVVLSVVSYFIFQWATKERGPQELNPATLRLFADEKAAKGKEKSAKSATSKHKPQKLATASTKPHPEVNAKEKASGPTTGDSRSTSVSGSNSIHGEPVGRTEKGASGNKAMQCSSTPEEITNKATGVHNSTTRAVASTITTTTQSNRNGGVKKDGQYIATSSSRHPHEEATVVVQVVRPFNATVANESPAEKKHQAREQSAEEAFFEVGKRGGKGGNKQATATGGNGKQSQPQQQHVKQQQHSGAGKGKANGVANMAPQLDSTTRVVDEAQPTSALLEHIAQIGSANVETQPRKMSSPTTTHRTTHGSCKHSKQLTDHHTAAEIIINEKLAHALGVGEPGSVDLKHFVDLFKEYQMEVKAKESELHKTIDSLRNGTSTTVDSKHSHPASHQHQRVEAVEAENTSLRHELKEQKEKYDKSEELARQNKQTYDEALRHKVVEANRLAEENERLSTTLNKNHQKVQQCRQLLCEVELLKQELKQKAQVESADVTEAKRTTEQLRKEKAELETACRDAMAAKIQAESALKRAQDQAQQRQQSDNAAANSETLLKEKVEELNSELDRALVAYNTAKANQHVQTKERDALNKEVATLRSEVEQWKKSFLEAEEKLEKGNTQLAEMTSVAERLRSAEKQSSGIVERYGQLEASNRSLEEMLSTTKQQLAQTERLSEKHKAECGRLEEELAKQCESQAAQRVKQAESSATAQEQQLLASKNRELEAQIIRLEEELVRMREREREKSVAPPPSHVPTVNSHASGEELAAQKQRNQALREANYKLLEAVQAQEALAKKLATELEAKSQISATNGGSASTTPSSQGDARHNEELETQLVHYKKALSDVNRQLGIVQATAEEMERSYCEQIGSLEQKLASSDAS